MREKERERGVRERGREREERERVMNERERREIHVFIFQRSKGREKEVMKTGQLVKSVQLMRNTDTEK